MKVRNKVPVRRKNPTKNPTGAKCKWSLHKPDLKEDFDSHCGYCGSFDGFRHTYFELDHFVPKSLFKKTGKIGLCQYDNLTYSCKFCNNKKLDQWPTNDESKPHENDKGFVDACDPDYDNHLYRMSDGSIMWKTQLGKWMVTTGFKFDERQRGIQLLWNLNQLRLTLNALLVRMQKHPVGSTKYQAIKEKTGDFAIKYFQYHQKLMEYYDA